MRYKNKFVLQGGLSEGGECSGSVDILDLDTLQWEKIETPSHVLENNRRYDHYYFGWDQFLYGLEETLFCFLNLLTLKKKQFLGGTML